MGTTNLFRQALFDELNLCEGSLNTENGLDFSIPSEAGKIHPDAMAALLKQATILAFNCQSQVGGTEDGTQEAFMLNEVLEKIDAIDFCCGTREAPEDWTTNVKSIISPLPNEWSEYLNSLDDYFEALLGHEPADENAKSKLVATKNRAKQADSTFPIVPTKSPQKFIPDSNCPGEVKPNSAFVTAGQMMGRPAPAANKSLPSINNSNPPRRPVGLSKRIKSTSSNMTPLVIGDESMETADEPIDPRLKGIDPKLLETIKNEIIRAVDTVTWEDIAGLDHAKNTIKEIVIWPMLRPDIFTGLRGPPKGLLLFGPPGTGKTMIGKCIASQAKATFFSISASSLTSKWVGEGEKLVRALFACARALQPSVVFIDEIDSLLTQRTDGEFEASRRIKTEFLVQFDGASTSSSDRILIIGATNRPGELDEAARRRLVKRLYIPLPDASARRTIISNLIGGQKQNLSQQDIDLITEMTDGYSGADVDNLCREAALGPIRGIQNILEVSVDQVRPICFGDFSKAMSQVRASVSAKDLDFYLDWNEKFGSLSASI